MVESPREMVLSASRVQSPAQPHHQRLDDTHTLKRQTEAALATLAEGKARAKGGMQAVSELRGQLAGLVVNLGLDLREVQENVVENAAMYANCPEVLGGMLQLVFCLDLLGSWLADRDTRVKDMSKQLEALEESYRICSRDLARVSEEVTTSSEKASASQLALELEQARCASLASSLQSLEQAAAEARMPRPSTQVALEAGAGAIQEVEQLRIVNAALNAELEQARRHVSSVARADRPAEALLKQLEQLEPMLAQLPPVTNAGELQEEACQAYGHLRAVVLEAVQHNEGGYVPGAASYHVSKVHVPSVNMSTMNQSTGLPPTSDLAHRPLSPSTCYSRSEWSHHASMQSGPHDSRFPFPQHHHYSTHAAWPTSYQASVSHGTHPHTVNASYWHH